MKQTTYTVAPGDNLSKIAKQHGIKSWKLLYFDPVNEPFRKLHPNPDLLRPGAKILIPKDPRMQEMKLRQRLTDLKRLRQQIVTFGEQGKQDLQRSKAQVLRDGETVDALATVATLMVGLGALLKKGFAWNAAKGVAQKELADDIVKGSAMDLAKKHRDAAAILISAGESNTSSPAWLALKAVAQAWCDITSPSFWANTVSQLNVDPVDPDTWPNLLKVNWTKWSKSVVTKPQDVAREAAEKWDRLIRGSVTRLDEQIREVEKALL